MFNIKVLATCFGCDQPSLGQIYIHLVDLHNEYLRYGIPCGVWVTYNEYSRVVVLLNISVKIVLYLDVFIKYSIVFKTRRDKTASVTT
jgi:hypothetical protein